MFNYLFYINNTEKHIVIKYNIFAYKIIIYKILMTII